MLSLKPCSILIFITLFKIFENSPLPENLLPSSLNKRKSNVILCDFGQVGSRSQFDVNRPCHRDSFSFSFSAYFHNKNFLRMKNLKQLAQTLSEYSICEVKFMKFNQENQSLEYFNSGDKFYWYQDKKFNDSYSPEVFILKDSLDANKKRIVFKCQLPTSDVYLSLNGDAKAYKPAQSHPLPSYRVTVSALHVRLNFMQIESLNINLEKNTNDPVYNLIDNVLDISSQDFLPKKSTERFMVYYDSRCKNCSIGNMNPVSVKCGLKEKTCEYEGSCFKDREIYTPFQIKSQNEIPALNAFVCNSNYSQTSLYMPCAINNGNCGLNQTCVFNAKNFDLKCQDN